MSVDWTNELELTFIECFQAEPVLWKVNSKDYKNKLKQHDAWKRISTIMDIPIVDLKTKKNSLFASFRGYKNKVKKSINSGAGTEDVYKPIWFAYELMDSFLGDHTKCKNSTNTVTQSTNSEINLEQEGGSPDNESVTTNSLPAVPTIRRRNHPSELSEAGRIMEDAMSTFKDTLKSNQTQSIRLTKEDDDCDLYAKLLATKLRKLPEHIKLRLMHDIDGMFLNLHDRGHSESSPQPHDTYQFTPRNSSGIPPRPGTSSSCYSEPPLHYSPMTMQNTYAQDINNSPSVIIQSNDIIRPAVYQIQDPTDADTNIVISSSEVLNSSNVIWQEDEESS